MEMGFKWDFAYEILPQMLWATLNTIIAAGVGYAIALVVGLFFLLGQRTPYKIVNVINRAQLDLGMLETRKHAVLHQIVNFQDDLTGVQKELEEKYGTFDVNIQDGTINYKEDEPSDS